MEKSVSFDSKLERNSFIVGVDDYVARKRQDSGPRVAGTHVIGREISGRHFGNIDISLEPNSTVVIIGDNVRGRDELINVIAGEIPPMTGNIRRNETSKVEFVAPSFDEDEIDDFKHKSIKDIFFESRGIFGMEAEIAKLYEASSDNSSALTQAGKLQETFENLGGYDAITEAEQIIEGLNVAGNEHDDITLNTNVNQLSSGQISKILIGKALYSSAGVIVMNDPSVHLDVSSKTWLEAYINSSKQTIVVATSDMQFAENIATKVIEVTDSGLVVQCATDFRSFILQRDRILTQWEEDARQKQKEIQEKKTYLKDFLGPIATRSASMGQAKKSTETLVARLESEYEILPGKKLIEARNVVRGRKFEVAKKSSELVMQLQGLIISYEQSNVNGLSVLSMKDLKIFRGNKLAIIGRNGSGKSTLLKALNGDQEEMLVEGNIDISESVATSYYSPYTKLPSGDQTIMGALRSASGSDSGNGAIMEYWGFKRSDFYDTKLEEIRHKDEIARAQLAILMAAKSNFIMLDEPTSYLTPVFRDRLIGSLKDFSGTLLVVSHDPYFLEALELNGTLSMPDGLLKLAGSNS